MTLAEYMEQRELSDAEFAKRAGLQRPVVWMYRTGRRQPRPPNLVKIETATRGQVRAKDF